MPGTQKPIFKFVQKNNFENNL